MANNSTEAKKQGFLFTIRHYPAVINGRINTMAFLNATSDLVALVERLGKVFAPVKKDMQGNINKINLYKYDSKSCLLELIVDEINKGENKSAEGVLWLNRALLFFELVFQGLLRCLQSDSCSDSNMKEIYIEAYEGSIKKYHNWAAQQLFKFICKMSPTLPQIMKSLETEDVKELETNLTKFNVGLHKVRCKIDDFFKEINLFGESL